MGNDDNINLTFMRSRRSNIQVAFISPLIVPLRNGR
jgi:hypothetical protein